MIDTDSFFLRINLPWLANINQHSLWDTTKHTAKVFDTNETCDLKLMNLRVKT